MRLQSFFSIFSLHRHVRPRLGKVEMHLLVEDVEPLQFIDRILRRVDRVVDNEGLPLRLDILLRDDVDDVAILGEDLAERLDQKWDFRALVEVADLARVVSGLNARGVCRVQSSYVDPIGAVSCGSETLRLFVRCAMYERCAGWCLVILGCHDEVLAYCEELLPSVYTVGAVLTATMCR